MAYIIYHNKDGSETNTTKIRSIDLNIYRKLMCNDVHKKFCYEISKDIIEKQFNIKIEKEVEKVNIILMNQLNEDQLELYLSTFDEEPDNLEKYAEYLSIITFNQVSPNNFLIKKKLNSLIEEISNYWENKNNCNYTLNNRFVERRFNNISFIGKIQNINNSITNKIYEKVINDHDLNYLNDIVRDNKFIDSEIKKIL
jgi:hypothetical protein